MDPPAIQYEEPKRKSSPSSGISMRRRSKANGSNYKRIALILSLTVLSLFWIVTTVYLQIFSAKIGQQSGIIIYNNTKDMSESESIKGEY